MLIKFGSYKNFTYLCSMEKDKNITDVIFRVDTSKDWKGTVFALLPYEVERNGSVTSYQHVGQHSSANYNHCISTSRPALPAEYADLKAEMESIGYNFNVVKKANNAKYLTSYKAIRK